ncbi:hypothetical protein HDU91_001794 [Kappamyces sp. JEL0680]|nr:hypothetical protein HDU91_001794 [Kappamyces sp. JEL0680]
MTSTEIDLTASISNDGVWQASFTPKNMEVNAFCSGLSQMENGSILVAGGDNGSYQSGPGVSIVNGRRGLRIYGMPVFANHLDPCPPGAPSSCQGTWTMLPGMNSDRWYPTVATLGDGSNIIVGGSTIALPNYSVPIDWNNPTYEYYPPRSGNWPRQLDLLQWAFPFNLYPQTIQTPSGSVFVMASNKSILINPDDSITPLPDHPPDLDHRPWIYPWTPTMVVLPMTIENNFKFTLMVCGGTTLSSGAAESASDMCIQISPNDPNPTWETVPDRMPTGRLMPDAVILPDGKILYVNGLLNGEAGGGFQGMCGAASNPVFQTDIYDPISPQSPGTSRWRTLAKASQMRLYHSGALLTETGHVITFGNEVRRLAANDR